MIMMIGSGQLRAKFWTMSFIPDYKPTSFEDWISTFRCKGSSFSNSPNPSEHREWFSLQSIIDFQFGIM